MKKNDHRHENAKRIMKIAGYASGGSVGAGNVDNQDDEYNDPHDKKIAKALDEKGGKKAGYVNGGAPKKRLDKPSRKASPVQMARGGATKKKDGKTQVNVIIAGKDGAAQSAPMSPPMMPPRPPMAPPAGVMPPQGGAPAGMPPRPPGMNRGGKVHADEKQDKKLIKKMIHKAEEGKKLAKGGAIKMTAGAGGGLGRLEKAKEYGGKPLKKGGAC